MERVFLQKDLNLSSVLDDLAERVVISAQPNQQAPALARSIPIKLPVAFVVPTKSLRNGQLGS